jgi:hypothetical protein
MGVFSISCEEENNERMKEMGQPWILAWIFGYEAPFCDLNQF